MSELETCLDLLTAKKYDQALAIITPLAQANNPEAQCLMGNIYHLGLGVKIDIEKAISWYAKAADQNHPVAANNLAGIYQSGAEGIASNPIKADHYYQQAKELNFPHITRNDQIAAITVHLFASELDEKNDQPVILLKDKYLTILDKFGGKLDLNLLPPAPEKKRFELLETGFSPEFESHIKIGNSQLKGFVYPVKIHDSYNWGISLYINNDKDRPFSPSDLAQFNPDEVLLAKNIKTSLGQTIFIIVELLPNQGNNDQDLLKIAEKCCQSFSPNSQLELERNGKFMSGDIFEYIGSDRLIIWLIQDPELDQKFNECYKLFADLFYFRHKIISSFAKSRDIFAEISSSYKNLKADLGKIFVDEGGSQITDKVLENWQKDLINLLNFSLGYTDCLQTLADQKNTIFINQKNYKNRLTEIEKTNGNSMDFWANFIDEDCPTYQQQIEVDLNYYVPGEKLLEQSINALRGLIEAKQAEIDQKTQNILQENENKENIRDKKLENTIQSLSVGIGVGVGVAGVIAGSFSLAVSKDYQWQFPSRDQPFLPPHPFISAVLFSLLFGGVIGSLIWWLIKRDLDKKLPEDKKAKKRQEEEQSNSSQSNQNPSNTLPSGSQQEVNIHKGMISKKNGEQIITPIIATADMITWDDPITKDT